MPVPQRAIRGQVLRVRTAQIVTVQVALALLLAAAGHGPLAGTAAALTAAALVLGAWARLRHRWLFEWLTVGLRYLTRRHTLAATAEPLGLLGLLAPTARVLPTAPADTAAVISDRHGLITVLELGDPAWVLTDTPQALPAPTGLLPAADAQSPPTRIQLLLTAVAAAGGGAQATSYRQLTDGRVLGHERVLLAVRVLRADGWSDDDLLRALSSTVRRVRRRLAPVSARPLDDAAALRVLAETAQHDDVQPVRESWSAMRLGGCSQVVFRLQRWPDLRAPSARRLVPRLLALPAMTTTVSLSAGPHVGGDPGSVAVDLTVRLTAADAIALSFAAQALCRLLDAANAHARRLDGEHLDGLAATLPLGLGAPAPMLAPADTLDVLDLPLGTAGLMVGANRYGAPVTVRLFRAEPTRAVLIGGLSAAQLIVLRAMALGARVVVRTGRPLAWEPFVRGARAPGETIALIPPNRAIGGPPASPAHPLLVVVDVGPAAADPPSGPGWQASLVVRDELATTDVETVSRADIVLLQPLRPDEAALAGTALDLGESAQWLTRIRDDMVAVISRRAVRWALLSATPIEYQLVGPPARR